MAKTWPPCCTRIGRLPADKALETARKLCAGLAAAHDRGIIHRDLKPQNIMMNKRGDVVIMDFGLAAIADQLSGSEVRNGTPAYMAPEQLRGAEVTARSDIYALGLVLYELFTGKRPYDARNIQEMLRQQESAQLTSMTSIAADIDPGVEKAIRRCLDPDPARRPANVLSVAAALPGGDPLAAALAAGEMPSPELVAAAGKQEGLATKYSVPCLIAIVLCLCVAVADRARYGAIMHAPADIPPVALAHEARQMAASFGYPKKPADDWFHIENRDSIVDSLKQLPGPPKWDQWLAAESPIAINYRESQSNLVADPYGEVSETNPPPTAPGMVHESVDGAGRLLEFEANPYADAPPLTAPHHTRQRLSLRRTGRGQIHGSSGDLRAGGPHQRDAHLERAASGHPRRQPDRRYGALERPPHAVRHRLQLAQDHRRAALVHGRHARSRRRLVGHCLHRIALYFDHGAPQLEARPGRS